MAENTKIEWADHTFNPWVGCRAVSLGCAHCYAQAMVERFGKDFAKRTRTGEANWKLPLKWNAKPWVYDDCGESFSADVFKPNDGHTFKGVDGTVTLCRNKTFHRARVFCASLSDWLDDEVPLEWLADLLKLIHDTPNLDWLLLTKRPENWAPRMQAVAKLPGASLPEALVPAGVFASTWLRGYQPPNVWIGTTVENQEWADRRIPELLKIPAKVRFLSCEPLLGPVDLGRWVKPESVYFSGDSAALKNQAFAAAFSEMIEKAAGQFSGLHWVICGGESGRGDKIRPMHPDWARSLRDQCQAAGVPFFFKQWGEHRLMVNAGGWVPFDAENARRIEAGEFIVFSKPEFVRVGKKAAGRLLDGREWSEFPEGAR